MIDIDPVTCMQALSITSLSLSDTHRNLDYNPPNLGAKSREIPTITDTS
jgi:hypothetical protein